MAAAKKKEPKAVEPEVVVEDEAVEVEPEVEAPADDEPEPDEPEVEVEVEEEVAPEPEPEEAPVAPADHEQPDASAVRRSEDGKDRDAGGNPVHVGIFGAGAPDAPDDRARTRA